MSRRLPRLWRRIRLPVKFTPHKTSQQIVGLILLGLLAFITTVWVPVSAQRVTGTSEIAQTSEAQSLLQQGIERYEAEQFSEAIGVWQRAVSTFASQRDSLNQALVLRYLSLAYQHLGHWDAAESTIAQSLKLLHDQKDIATTQGYLDVLAKALNTQARLQWVKGQGPEALETWKQATATYKQAGNQAGVIGSLINQGKVLQVLGLSSQAAAELQLVEQILQQQSDLNLKATGLQSLGEALRRVGNLRKSQEVLQKSWAVAKAAKLSRAQGLALLELGNTERALGNRSLAISKAAEAQTHTQAAIKFYQQAANSSNLQLPAQLNLFSLWVETSKWSEAAKLRPTIQQLIANLPPSQTTISARLNFAQSLMALQRGQGDKEIAQIIATAVQQARGLKDQRAESYALGQLGGLYELTEQWSAAQDLTQQALLLAEKMQAPDIGYRWEWQLGRLLEKQGNVPNAILAYKEAVAMLKSVRSDLLTIDAEVQFSFRDNVEPLHRKLVDLLLSPTATQLSQANLQEAIEVIDVLRLAELENFLSCNLTQTVQSNQDNNTADRRAAFVYPIILEDRLAVIARLPGQPLKHHVIPVSRTTVEKTARDLRASILKRNRPEAVIETATQVYQWLLAPLESDLESQDIKTLVFVLDGVLRNIPVSVLYDAKQQEYLMQKPYALALVPSSQLFDLQPLERKRLEVLTAGVSEQRNIEQRQFDELPNVEQELQQIGNVVPTESLLNPQFTEASLQQRLNSGAFSAVHIATHGKFSSDPEETFILAYNQLLRSNVLNNLLQSRNQSLSRSIELLVLSACETAQGDNRATLGLAGIAVRAGARSVLSTLWQVSDRSTAQLMGQFYQELTNPEVTKAEALHQAQLAVFKQYKSPYYWAPYVLVGNWL